MHELGIKNKGLAAKGLRGVRVCVINLKKRGQERRYYYKGENKEKDSYLWGWRSDGSSRPLFSGQPVPEHIVELLKRILLVNHLRK